MVNKWITEEWKNFHKKLHKADGALHYKIGGIFTNLRLKPRLPQNVLLKPKEDVSDSDSDLDL